MRYRLIVLTHGEAPYLEECLDSFAANIEPAEHDAVIVHDGGGPTSTRRLPLRSSYPVRAGPRLARGFSSAMRFAWAYASDPTVPWIFWLEHDFRFDRDVNLEHLAAVMDARPELTQIVLRRQPVNPEEVKAGSYVGLHPSSYRERVAEGHSYLEHGRHWSNNPSLFRSQLAAEVPWPDGPESEGKFTERLRALKPGCRFGIWGRLGDRPWVTHLGERDPAGFGY